MMCRRLQRRLQGKSASVSVPTVVGGGFLRHLSLCHNKVTEVPAVVHEVLRSPGQPLDPETQSVIELCFGHEFGHVRVHSDSKAAKSAQMFNAKAYTLGEHIIFGQNQYVPESPSGKRLIAHEVTHVIQQTQKVNDQSNFEVTGESDSSEAEARGAATTVGNGEHARAISPHPVAIQRDLQSGFDLTEAASPFLARVIGSVTVDGFETGEADISTDNEKKLKQTAGHIIKLLNQYPGSTVRVTGHTDAVDTPHYNMQLGWERAESVKVALEGMGVPADSIRTESKGEGELLVKTQKAEPQNRRVEVRFEPFVSPIGALFPELTLKPPKPLTHEPEEEKRRIELFPPPIYTYPPPLMGSPPASHRERRNWLEEGLKRDPLVRSLPEWMREKVIDGLKDADEKVAEKVIDSLPLDEKKKAALKAVAKSILQLLKGKRFKMPPSPLYEPPLPEFKGFPKMPGEKIFTLPPIRF